MRCAEHPQVAITGELGPGKLMFVSGDRQTVRPTVLPIKPMTNIFLYPFDTYNITVKYVCTRAYHLCTCSLPVCAQCCAVQCCMRPAGRWCLQCSAVQCSVGEGG